MIAAVLCLAIALTLGGVDVTTIQRTGIHPMLPNGALIRLATGRADGLRAGAMAEINRRRWLPGFDRETQRELALRIIDVQADETVPWHSDWNLWIRADTLNRLFGGSEAAGCAELRRSIEQTPFHPVLSTRTKVSDTSGLEIWMTTTHFRGDDELPMHCPSRDGEIWIDDQPLPQAEPPTQNERVIPWGSTVWLTGFVPLLNGKHLEPGTHRLRYHQRASIRTHDRDDRPSEPLRWVDLNFAGTFEVLPPGEEAIAAVPNPAFAAAIAKAIRVRHLETLDGRFNDIYLDIAETLPADIAFAVFADVNGHEQYLGDFAAAKGTRSSIGFGGRAVPFPAEITSVDLILRSKTAAAERSRTIQQIWRGEVVLQKVPVTQIPR